MSATLVVEVSDLAAAARSSFEAGRVLDDIVGAALRDAAGCTGMAGSDPAGLSWAARYSSSAGAAARAAQDVTNGVLRLSSLLGATAANYADAENASTVAGERVVAQDLAELPPAETVTMATRIEAVGDGEANMPVAWPIVENIVHEIWPNGHQDIALRAAAAWQRSAAEFECQSGAVVMASSAPVFDGLAEGNDIRTTCRSLAEHMGDVAAAHRSLSRACQAFAHHLDVAHSKLLHELSVFLEESAAIEVVGNVLSALTFTVLEVPTQAAEAGRVAATVRAIVEILADFGLAVQDLVEALPLVSEIAGRASSAMDSLLSVRVVTAEVIDVPGLQMLSIARNGDGLAGAVNDTGELGAVARLDDDATMPEELRSALESPRCGEWNDPATLSDHFDDHGADFGAKSEPEYAEGAGEFFREAMREGFPTKVDANGNIRIYDPATNTFGSYTSDGATRTFFKPTSSTYWTRQKGILIR